VDRSPWRTKVVMLPALNPDLCRSRGLALVAADFSMKGPPKDEIVNAIQRVAYRAPSDTRTPYGAVKNTMFAGQAPTYVNIPLTTCRC